MNHSLSLSVLLILFLLTLAGCELIGNIFQAGVWAGVILVLLLGGIIAWIAWTVARGRG